MNGVIKKERGRKKERKRGKIRERKARRATQKSTLAKEFRSSCSSDFQWGLLILGYRAWHALQPSLFVESKGKANSVARTGHKSVLPPLEFPNRFSGKPNWRALRGNWSNRPIWSWRNDELGLRNLTRSGWNARDDRDENWIDVAAFQRV